MSVDEYLELILNGTSDLKEGSSCGVANATGDSLCEKFYGGNARFCRQGVCHCQQSLSYVENNRCSMFERFESIVWETYSLFQLH